MGMQYPSEKMSNGERELWFQIVAMKLPRPIYQHKFHSVRKWRVDFAYVDLRIAIEIEGMGRSDTDKKTGVQTMRKRCTACGQVPPSAHRSMKGYEDDIEKYNELRIDGWTHLQFTPAMVKSGVALQVLERCLKLRSAAPRSTQTCRPQ